MKHTSACTDIAWIKRPRQLRLELRAALASLLSGFSGFWVAAQDGGLGRSTVVGRKLCRLFHVTGANFLYHQDGPEICSEM